MKRYTCLLFVILLVVGCARQVKRLDENTTIDLSGRWNDTDSRLVAEEMVKERVQPGRNLGAEWTR